MKVHVVYDEEGHILAMLESKQFADASGRLMTSTAMALPGQHAAELEVPPKLDDLDIAALFRRVRVDTSGQHRLIATE